MPASLGSSTGRSWMRCVASPRDGGMSFNFGPHVPHLQGRRGVVQADIETNPFIVQFSSPTPALRQPPGRAGPAGIAGPAHQPPIAEGTAGLLRQPLLRPSSRHAAAARRSSRRRGPYRRGATGRWWPWPEAAPLRPCHRATWATRRSQRPGRPTR